MFALHVNDCLHLAVHGKRKLMATRRPWGEILRGGLNRLRDRDGKMSVALKDAPRAEHNQARRDRA